MNNPYDSDESSLATSLPEKIDHPAIRPLAGTPAENYQSIIRFGVDGTGKHVAWRPWLDPMMMIVGNTGGGRFAVAHSVLVELAAKGWVIDAVDHSRSFTGFRGWPNVRTVATSIEDQVGAANSAFDMMQTRFAQIENGEVHENDLQPYCLFLDDFSEFSAQVANWYSDVRTYGDPRTSPVVSRVESILRLGRAVRVHVVIIAGRPDALGLGASGSLANMSCRVSMGPLSYMASLALWESPNVVAIASPQTRGWGIAKNDAGEPVPFLAYWTPNPDQAERLNDLAILEGLRPATP